MNIIHLKPWILPIALEIIIIGVCLMSWRKYEKSDDPYKDQKNIDLIIYLLTLIATLANLLIYLSLLYLKKF